MKTRRPSTNPALIVEVLSRSTEEYDRADKFEHYKSLRSLRQYVLVSHRETHVEVWTRGADEAWSVTMYGDGDRAELSAVGASFDVRELYDSAADPPVA